MASVIPKVDPSFVSEKVPARVWLIWLCGALFYFYQFILRVSPGVMTDDLMQSFAVQGCTLGVLSAFYYNAYAAMQVPVGMLLDRFGARRLMSGAVCICATGAFLFGSSKTVEMASMGRFLMGVGSAFAYVGTLKMATLWFPLDKVGRVIGLTMVFGTVGAAMGGAPLAHLMDLLGWRETMLLMTFLGGCLALTCWMLLKDRPSDLGRKEPSYLTTEKVGFLKGLTTVLSNNQVWIIALYAALMYVPLSAFADLWGVPFIVEAYQIDRKIAASLISMIYIGVAVGSPITTFFSDYFKRRKIIMIGCAILSMLVYTILIYVPHIPMPLMYALLFLGGLAFTGQVLAFVSASQLVPLFATGVALGLTNMTVMSSGVIFEPLVGDVLEHTWTGVFKADGLPLYTVENFRTALMSIPLSLLGAVFLSFFVKETYPKD